MKLTELHKLSGRERAAYYRLQAEAALRAAEIASDSAIKVAHLLMAGNWEKLAEHCFAFDKHRRFGESVSPARHEVPKRDEISARSPPQT